MNRTPAEREAFRQRAREARAAAEAATDPADKAVYRDLMKAYEQLSGDGVPVSHKLLRRDLDQLKADTAAAIAEASAPAGAFPRDPNAPREHGFDCTCNGCRDPMQAPTKPKPAPAGSYFTVDSDGKAKPADPKPQTTRPTPVWKAPAPIEF